MADASNLTPNITLTITPGERIPVEEVYHEREQQRLQEQQYNAISMDPESARMQQAAEGGQKVAPPPHTASPLESTSEQVRNRAQASLQMPIYQKALEGVTKSVLGLSLEDLQKAVETGELPQHVNINMLQPHGAVFADAAREEGRRQAQESGLPPELADQIGGVTGMLAGVLFPSGKAKRKAAQVVEGIGKQATQDAERIGLSQQQRELFGKILRGEIPEAEVQTNLARVGGEESIRKTMAEINKLHADRLAISRKSHAATIEGSRGALTLEQALRMPEGTALNEDQMTALRDLYNSAAFNFNQIRRRVQAGETGLEDKFYESYLIASELAFKDVMAGRTGARAQEARKILSDADRAPITPADLVKIRERFAGSDMPTPQTLATMMDVLPAAQQKQVMARIWAGAKEGQNWVYEAWINGLLSSPTTHAGNIASNALVALWAPSERFLSATFDPVILTGERGVYHGESIAMLRAWTEATKDGFRLGWEALKTGKPIGIGGEKVERAGHIGAAGIGVDPEGAVGSFLDFLGAVIRSPGRGMMAEDAAFKTFNYRMELHAQAYRMAKQEGLEGEAFARRVSQLQQIGTDFLYGRGQGPAPEIVTRAANFAAVQTFNQELSKLGFVGGMGSLGRAIADYAPAGRIVAPFVNTPTNLVHYSHERTPLLNILSDTLQADIWSGNAERRALALGKVGTSLALGGTLAAIAASGTITGPGPADPTLKELKMATGWMPYSLCLGGKCYSFSRLDPLGLTLGAIGTYAEIAGELPADARLQYAMAIGLAIQNELKDKTYFQGVAQFFELLTSGDENKITKYLESIARSAKPFSALGGAITRQMDPYRVQTHALTELEQLANAFKANIPGFSKDLPPRRNLWGDPIQLPAGVGWDFVSPIYTSTLQRDPVTDEILRLKVKITKPSPVLPIMGVGRQEQNPMTQMEDVQRASGLMLNPAEYDDYAKMVGKGVQGAPPLKDALATLMRSTEYQRETDGPDGGKALLIQRTVQAYKKAAMAELLSQNDTLRDLYEQKIQQRIDLLDPEKNPPKMPGQLQDALKNLLPSLGR